MSIMHSIHNISSKPALTSPSCTTLKEGDLPDGGRERPDACEFDTLQYQYRTPTVSFPYRASTFSQQSITVSIVLLSNPHSTIPTVSTLLLPYPFPIVPQRAHSPSPCRRRSLHSKSTRRAGISRLGRCISHSFLQSIDYRIPSSPIYRTLSFSGARIPAIFLLHLGKRRMGVITKCVSLDAFTSSHRSAYCNLIL